MGPHVRNLVLLSRRILFPDAGRQSASKPIRKMRRFRSAGTVSKVRKTVWIF